MDQALLLLVESIVCRVLLAHMLVIHFPVLWLAFEIFDYYLNVSELVFGDLKICLGLEPRFSDRFLVGLVDERRLVNFILAVFVDLIHGLLVVQFHACNLILCKSNEP